MKGPLWLGLWAGLWGCGGSGLLGEGKPIAGPSLIDTGTDIAPDTGPTDGPEGFPAICVNEWVASNVGGFRLNDGQHPDWLELHNPGRTDAPLEGWRIGDSDDPEEAERLSPELVVPAGGELVLFADGRTELGPQHLALSLDADGETVALFAPDGGGEVWVYEAVESDIALARITDCCVGDDCWAAVRDGTPGVGNADGGDAREVLVEAGSEWRYLDTNSEPEAGWTNHGYSDSAWALGVAPLGYGDAHQVTVLSPGAEGARNISAWFRQEFYVTDAGRLHDLELELLVDDGARVWINGAELLRVNLPEGEVTASTLATATVGGANEIAYIRYAIDGAVLADTGNVLSVEVHQASVTSSDMGMDARLTALRL